MAYFLEALSCRMRVGCTSELYGDLKPLSTESMHPIHPVSEVVSDVIAADGGMAEGVLADGSIFCKVGELAIAKGVRASVAGVNVVPPSSTHGEVGPYIGMGMEWAVVKEVGRIYGC